MSPMSSLIRGYVLPSATAANPVVPSAGMLVGVDKKQVVMLCSNCNCF